MERLMWALGSMLFVGIILCFLPIGLSKLGKLIVLLIGLVLTLGGIAVTVSFSLWQTLLLLAVLVLFVAYILDNRFRKIIYLESNRLVDKVLFAEEEEWSLPETSSLEEVTQVELPTDSFHKSASSEELPTFLFDNPQEMDEDLALLLNPESNLEEAEKSIEFAESDYLAEIEDLLEARMDDEKVMIELEEELAIREFEEQIEHENDPSELILSNKGAV